MAPTPFLLFYLFLFTSNKSKKPSKLFRTQQRQLRSPYHIQNTTYISTSLCTNIRNKNRSNFLSMDRVKQLSQNQQREREKLGQSNGVKATKEGESPSPFMGVKARRFASFRMAVKDDYLDTESNSSLSDILSKRGDQKLLFADKITKLTGSGRLKQLMIMITDRAIYLADMDSSELRRRISLASIDRICLSKLKDNFFALIIPTEYDCLMASTRKTQIVSILVEATKIKPAYEIGVVFSNRFEYRSAADTTKIVQFEEIEGGIKTRFLSKTYL